MTTTRIVNQLDEKYPPPITTAPLDRVEPTHALLITAMPCEERAAMIRNKTVDSMEKNDKADVAFRYLQNKEGELNTSSEVFVWGLFTLLSTLLLAGSEIIRPSLVIRAIMTCCILGFTAELLPNIHNSRRYAETKEGCGKWLTQQLSRQPFKKIESLSYNEPDIHRLCRLLQDENISSASVEAKLGTPRHFSRFA